MYTSREKTRILFSITLSIIWKTCFQFFDYFQTWMLIKWSVKSIFYADGRVEVVTEILVLNSSIYRIRFSRVVYFSGAVVKVDIWSEYGIQST